jgi:hypothetical protein
MKREVREKLKLIKQTERDTAKCIFCGSSPTTREHVFSGWTHKYMLPRKPGKAASYVAVEHIDRVVGTNLKLPGPIRDWQVKCVCGPCNNGWMSVLDQQVEPMMKPLILGQPTRLFDKECQAIATWAVLKSMIVHNSIVHHTRRKVLKRTRKPPKDWAVWIANYERQTWEGEWLSWPVSVRENAEMQPRRPSAYNAHITIQMIKNLYIHVTNLPYPDFGRRWRFRRPDGLLLAGDVIRIWPLHGTSIVWPQKPLLDEDAMLTSQAVLLGLKRNDIAARRLATDGTLTRAKIAPEAHSSILIMEPFPRQRPSIKGVNKTNDLNIDERAYVPDYLNSRGTTMRRRSLIAGPLAGTSLTSPEYKQVDWIEIDAHHLRQAYEDQYWPAQYRPIRDQLPKKSGTPRFLVVQAGKVVANRFGGPDYWSGTVADIKRLLAQG